jgi:hypothetical protein
MPHTRSYGRHGNTYTYPVNFKDLPPARIQELVFNDGDVEVTGVTWITQTTNFIAKLKAALNEHTTVIIDVRPTMEPEYALKVTVPYDGAYVIQDKVNQYLLNLPADLRID